MIQKAISDILYALSNDEIFYEEAYDKIAEAIKEQKVDFELQGLIPTMDLLIEKLENND